MERINEIPFELDAGCECIGDYPASSEETDLGVSLASLDNAIIVGSNGNDRTDDGRNMAVEEKHLFASVRDFFKEAPTDYNPNSVHCKSFYAVVQDKFHCAVSAMTAAKIILDRANHKQPNMGIQTFDGNLPTVQEAKVGKRIIWRRTSLLSCTCWTVFALRAVQGDARRSR